MRLDRERLIKLLNLTGSEYDAEALSAIRRCVAAQAPNGVGGAVCSFAEPSPGLGHAVSSRYSQTSPAISAGGRILDFAKGRINFAELATDALDG